MIKRLESLGYTLVELLIISPILMVVIVVMMSYLFNQYGQLTQQGVLINLRTEAQTITFSMQDDVFFANQFAQTKNQNLDDPYAPSGGWTYDTDPPTLIISTPALTDNRRADERDVVYIDTLGCDPNIVEQNEPLYNNVIYFAEGNVLYKRVLSAPVNMATCGTSYMEQTCPEDHSSEDCSPDVIVTRNLHNFDVTYFTANNAETDDPEQAEKVTVTIELSERAFAEDIYASSAITLKKLNQ